MLKYSDTNIELASSVILNHGHDVAFLVPTVTGMEKSIMDAHDSLRAFLCRNNIHDYSKQAQGAKEIIEASYISSSEVKNLKVSLYRPKTKLGDPRIWIYGLKNFVVSYNLIALIYSNNQLYIVNCSNPKDLSFALSSAIPEPKLELNDVADELLSKLKSISNKGFINSLRKGDTGIGMTLETLLGIEANSSKSPDYKGIELKATRIQKNKKQRNKNQLFSKTPSWTLSPIETAENLVLERGYVDKDGHKALRHTISGHKPNSLGLYLDIDYANDHLRQMFSNNEVHPVHDMTWILNDLRKALAKKHNETFWVKALHNNDRTNEAFHYIEVEHTSSPYISKLETLIETGLITLDYTLHLKPSGKARDHGYLFKIKPSNMEALFPKPIIYSLTE